MSTPHKPQAYRDMIDALVEVCHKGQGQVGAERVRKGMWNRNATEKSLPDQHRINELLARLSKADREVLAGMLAQEVELGVFETLKVLEGFGVAPFEDGYEGAPYNDFIGRLADWKWPER